MRGDRRNVRTLLLACIAIDATDVVSAHLSRVAGLYNISDTRSLQLTAIATLIPEIMALVLIIFNRTLERIEVNKKREHPTFYSIAIDKSFVLVR